MVSDHETSIEKRTIEMQMRAHLVATLESEFVVGESFLHWVVSQSLSLGTERERENFICAKPLWEAEIECYTWSFDRSISILCTCILIWAEQ